jgi:predicted RNA-binding Zn ribbon-like protein
LETSLTVPVAEDAPRRDPAPGNLELIRQMVNTRDVESGWEGLNTPADAADWLAERGLMPPRRRLTDADLATTVALREALRDALAANAGHADRAAAHSALDHLAAHYPLRVRVNGRAHLEARGSGIAPAMGALLAVVYDAMTTGTWDRLKICRNDECQWAYYDHSRNHSGAWCTMAVCGNRMKGRSFRERRAATAAG